MKWQDRGFDTPFLNKTLFRKIRYFLGGRVRLMLSGGAPLAPDTHSLARTCLCGELCRVLQIPIYLEIYVFLFWRLMIDVFCLYLQFLWCKVTVSQKRLHVLRSWGEKKALTHLWKNLNTFYLTSFHLNFSPQDRTTGRAGAPLMNVRIKIVNWEEGNYTIKDKPYPRGEIHVGGRNVAMGYFKNEGIWQAFPLPMF